MGSNAWILVMFTLLASVLPVHALIVSARGRRADIKAKSARDKRGRAARRDERE